jgi:hypothetical protein
MMLNAVKNIGLFLVTFFIMMVLLDFYAKYAAVAQVTIFKYDSHIGRVFVNNAPYFIAVEGLAVGNINSYGYIGPSYSPEKDTGTVRIALMGDSFIEGFQHFDRHHLRAVIEKELKEKYGIQAEVMNFGKFGYNLLDMYANYVNYVKSFKPDITLFFVSNLDLVEAPEREGMPYPYVQNDSLKILYYEDSGSRLPWFLSMNRMGMLSPTVQMIRNSINLYRKGETMRIIFGKFYDPFDKKNYEEETAESTDVPATVHKKILEELSLVPGNIIVHRDKYDMTVNITSAVNGSGIKTIFLNDTLRAIQDKGINPYYREHTEKEGHWNSEAHHAIGIFLAGKLYSMLNDIKDD